MGHGRCHIMSCRNSSVYVKHKIKPGGRLTFHLFPMKSHLRNKWIELCRIETHLQRMPKSSYLCSEHFVASDYIQGDRKKRLLQEALPSIFPWTKRKGVVKASFHTGKVEDGATLHRSTSMCCKKATSLSSIPVPDTPIFKPENARRTYAKTLLPTAFIEEYPMLSTAMNNDDNDPLKTEVIDDTVDTDTARHLDLFSDSFPVKVESGDDAPER